MDIRLGFIGTGNMGTPMLRSIVKSGLVAADKVSIYDPDACKMEALRKELGVSIKDSGADVVENSDVIVLAVKPDIVKPALEACKERFDSTKLLITIAAGLPIKLYSEALGPKRKIVRIMPNTPAMVGEGMTLMSYGDFVERQDKEIARSICECFGKVEELPEKLMSEVIALTSSSPAYVFVFIEAMADAAVKSGIPRALAYKLAAQAVLGSAKMVLETGKHPGELKDKVCSPGGTTIEAVAALEKNGFRHAVMYAMDKCTDRAREMGKIYG